MGDKPTEDVNVSLNEDKDPRGRAYVYNVQADVHEEADTNFISTRFRDTTRQDFKRPQSRSPTNRDQRRRDIDDRRSSSRENLQSRNRTVSFDLPQETQTDHDQHMTRSRPHKSLIQDDFHATAPNFQRRETRSPSPKDNLIEVFQGQQKMIEDLQKRIDNLTFRSPPNKDTQYWGNNQRTRSDRTFDIPNQFPNKFQIRINPGPQDLGNYQEYRNNFRERPYNQVSNTRYTPFGEYQQERRNSFCGRFYDNTQPWNQSQPIRPWQGYDRRPQGQQSWQDVKTRQTYQDKETWNNQLRTPTGDRQYQRQRLAQCPYCSSTQRHDWFRCGEERNKSKTLRPIEPKSTHDSETPTLQQKN